MSTLTWVGSALGLLTYFPLWKQIRAGDVEQNVLTWALWAALDSIIAAAIFSQGGSFLLPMIYGLGSLLTVIFLIRSGNKAVWTWFEVFVAFLAFLSMVVWYLSGDKVATIASSVAMMIASIPQIKDAWKKPREMPLLVYCSYLVANCLVTAGGADWSIKDRFYPTSATFVCGFIVALTLRKYRRVS